MQINCILENLDFSSFPELPTVQVVESMTQGCTVATTALAVMQFQVGVVLAAYVEL